MVEVDIIIEDWAVLEVDLMKIPTETVITEDIEVPITQEEVVVQIWIEAERMAMVVEVIAIFFVFLSVLIFQVMGVLSSVTAHCKP